MAQTTEVSSHRVQDGELYVLETGQDTCATWHLWVVCQIENSRGSMRNGVYLTFRDFAGEENGYLKITKPGGLILLPVWFLCHHEQECGNTRSLRFTLLLGE